MKILFGTTNESKFRSMKRVTDDLGIELIRLSDLNMQIPEIDEIGDDILENAELKAHAYWQAYHLPVFSCDSGLYFENVEDSLQPVTHVRRVNGKDLTDEEMIDYYGKLARSHGGALIARYRNAVFLIINENTIFYCDDASIACEPFLLTDVPHARREKGYPLDSLSKDIRTGRYYFDLPNDSFKDNTVDQGFHAFFKRVLNDPKTMKVTMNYEINQISLADYPKCNAIWNMEASPYTQFFIDQIKEGNREVYILTVDGEYIAECDLVYDNLEYGTVPGKRLYLSRLIVKKEQRGRGFGKAISQYVINIAEEKGYCEIALGVNCDNTSAVGLYESLGFTVYEEAEDEDGKFYRMEKLL